MAGVAPTEGPSAESKIQTQSAVPPLWRLAGGRVQAETPSAAALDRPHPAGSLQKPFLVRAWAESHPGERPPRLTCEPSSHCWLASGHGALDLRRAVAVSCNAYFLELAQATPPATIEVALRAAGFEVQAPITPGAAIGLESGRHALVITPRALLLAYDRLVREPWPRGEEVHADLLAGLRDAGLEGTALGLAQRGLYAKTGTVSSLEGRRSGTSGWALVVDGAGWGLLTLVPRGTGREAAAALAGPLSRERPWSSSLGRAPHAHAREHAPANGTPSPAVAPVTRRREAPERITVLLLHHLKPRAVRATNAARAPLATSRGWIGAGASLDLRPGDHLSEGLWRLTVDNPRFTRSLAATLTCRGTAGGGLRLVADMSLAEYVAGVMAAELPDAVEAPRLELGAAILRFLARGPRHRGADVCDSTHCAWFVGRGPRLRWPEPQQAILVNSLAPEAPLSEAEWRLVRAMAREPGPSQWTSHCGGAPLSGHAVWGNGDLRITRCPRHTHPTAHWRREWTATDLERAFGSPVAGLTVEWLDGVWTLRVRFAGLAADRLLRYDDAHRTLAAVLGWAGLPSPADHIDRTAQGFVVTGVGRGHRVGVCLAGEP